MLLISEAVREARHHAGLTQRQAADLLGVPLPTFRAWEQSRTRPGIDVLCTLSKVCRGNVLITPDGPMFEPLPDEVSQ